MRFLPRHLRTTALAALSCTLFLAFPASPAFAHDALKRSSPAKNAELSSLKEVELEYSAGVKFPFVVLHDTAGKEVALGKPDLDGPLVTAEVPQPLTPGAYVIAWRVVSSDGHPIEGEIPFSVKGSSLAPSPTGGAVDVATLAAEPSAAAGEAQAAAPGVPAWIWGGLAVLVVVGAFVLLRTGRRRPDRGEADAD